LNYRANGRQTQNVSSNNKVRRRLLPTRGLYFPGLTFIFPPMPVSVALTVILTRLSKSAPQKRDIAENLAPARKTLYLLITVKV